MVTSQAPLAEILQRIGAVEQVYVRMALSRGQDGRFVVRSMVIDVLPKVWLDNQETVLSNWLGLPVVGVYPSAVLLSRLAESSQVCSWFTDKDASFYRYDARRGHESKVLRFEMPQLSADAQATRCYSFTKDGFVAMPWPHTVYRFTPQGPNWHHPEDFGPLTADDADYYPDFRSACAEVVYGVSDSTQFSNVNDGVAVRVIHADAWLNEVRIGQDKLTATVAGVNPRACRLELSGSPAVRRRHELQDSGRIELPLPEKLPEQLILAITRGNDELDRATYSERFPIMTSAQMIDDRHIAAGGELQAQSEVAVVDTALASESIIVAKSATLPDEELFQPPELQVHPKAFISYSHDAASHDARVLNFANRLVRDGIDCHLDQYEESPAQGWPVWMEDQIEWADYVLAVCTQTYKKRFRKKETPGKGLGATWESSILTQHLYTQAFQNTTIIPVVLTAEDVAHIPTVLQQFTHYNVSEAPDYNKLYARLTNQPQIVRPPLGQIRKLTPREEE